MNIHKPKTAATYNPRRMRHKRTSSQPTIKGINLNYKLCSNEVTPRGMIAPLPFSNTTKIDCSNFINYNIFNINGVLGNKAIMATTSPSLLTNTRASSRLKTTRKSKRTYFDYRSPPPEELEAIEKNHPLHYKPMTESGKQRERLIKTSMSERSNKEFQTILQDKDKTIQKLKNKLVILTFISG
jgi:hypothetical protein